MNLQNKLNQLFATERTNNVSVNSVQNIGANISNLTEKIPGGLIGSAAVGGIMELLVNNKSVRQFAGTTATKGGAAILGGLAYKAFKNWQHNPRYEPTLEQQTMVEDRFTSPEDFTPKFELSLIKAMIAAAKADGHIDATEQQRILQAVQQMDVSAQIKGSVFELLQKQTNVEEITRGVNNMVQKSEIYLASCLVINPDHPAKRQFLDELACALQLPPGLAQQIEWQAQQLTSEEAA